MIRAKSSRKIEEEHPFAAEENPNSVEDVRESEECGLDCHIVSLKGNSKEEEYL